MEEEQDAPQQQQRHGHDDHPFHGAATTAELIDGAGDAVHDDNGEEEEQAPSIAFVPVYGINNDAAMCYVLYVKGVKLLLDCGWTDEFCEELVLPLELQAPDIDAVLLSHASMCHVGALPWLLSKLGCNAQVFTTVPVQRLGPLCLREALHCREAAGQPCPYSNDEVEAAFEHITQLRYHQTQQLPGGVTITAHPAGHDLGGAIWSIRQDADEVVYANHWTQKDDSHVSGANIISAFQRPTLMVADAYQRPNVDFEARNRSFLKTVMTTLRQDGTVLLPISAVGRLLDVLLLLNSFWGKEVNHTYPLLLCTGTCRQVLQKVQSLLEWMKSDLSKDLHQRGNPFDLRSVQLVSTLQDVFAFGPRPKVVLATLDSFTAGPARELLQYVAQHPGNTIILPGQPQPGSLASQLAAAVQLQGGQSGEQSRDAQEGAAEGPGPNWQRGPDGLWRVALQISRKVELAGEELEQYLQQQAEEQQQLSRAASQVTDMEMDGPADAEYTLPTRSSSGVIGKVIGGDVGAPQLLVTPSKAPSIALESQATDAPVALEDVLMEGFTLPEGARYAMFPYQQESDEEEALQFHEYGKPLLPGEFEAPRQDDEELRLAEEMQKEEPETQKEVPTKVVTEDVHITLRAQVMMFDFDNLIDQVSLRKFLQGVAPRHLVLVGASTASCQAMSAQCQQAYADDGVTVQVHVPEAEDVIDCSQDTGSLQVLLCPTLYYSLRKAGMQYITWLDGRIAAEDDTGCAVVEQGKAATADHSAQTGLRIGEAKLSTVQGALVRAGLACQFLRGQVLQSEGSVLFKVAASAEPGAVGQLLMEGPLSQAYYAARDAVYAQYDVC